MCTVFFCVTVDYFIRDNLILYAPPILSTPSRILYDKFYQLTLHYCKYSRVFGFSSPCWIIVITTAHGLHFLLRRGYWHSRTCGRIRGMDPPGSEVVWRPGYCIGFLARSFLFTLNGVWWIIEGPRVGGNGLDDFRADIGWPFDVGPPVCGRGISVGIRSVFDSACFNHQRIKTGCDLDLSPRSNYLLFTCWF